MLGSSGLCENKYPGTIRPLFLCRRLTCLTSCEQLFPAWAKSGSWRSFLRGCFLGAGVDLERKSALNIHWKNWCWSWNSSTLATWCEELTHWKRPWCWERLKAGGRRGDNRGWDGWMASPTKWTCVWVDSRSWSWAGRPGMLQSMGSQRIRHNWATELNWWWCDHRTGTWTLAKS